MRVGGQLLARLHHFVSLFSSYGVLLRILRLVGHFQRIVGLF
jgi:hypothetical protein